MAIRPLIIVLPLALGLGLAACDSRDYEAELAELQNQLNDATGELEGLRGENQSLSGEMAELRSQAEETAAAAGQLSEEVAGKVRGELESVLEKASQTVDRLAALERDPDAPADTRTEAVAILRNEVQQIVNSVQTAAADLGLDLQPGPTPAAAPEPEQPAAGEEGTIPEATPEQPAGQPTGQPQ
jgi:chromosome segregation ATPase